MQSGLSKDIEQFLIRNIDSVAELEGLLLMHRERGKGYTAPQLAGRLYITEGAAEEVLKALDRRGFLAFDSVNGFSYAPQSEVLEQAVVELAEVYSRFLIPITNLLHNKRSSAVQQFADAFRLREKK